MSVTRVSSYVLDDNAVTLAKIDVIPGTTGQVLATDGSGNLYFTDKLVTEDVEDVVANLIDNGTHTNITITYDDVNNSLSFNAVGAVSSVNTQTGAVVLTTTNITEGTNLYYTQARFDSAFSAKSTTNLAEGSNLYFTNTRARSSISATDTGGDGSLSYNPATGVITYTGPSAAEVRSHFSAGTGIAISNGQISIGQSVATTADVTFHDIDATGNVVVEGNLTVQGTTTTINAANLSVSDNMIYLNNAGEATITNAVGNGTTVTYTADNYFSAGYTVDVTGVDPTSFNVSGATIVSADSTSFTINSTVTDTYVSGGEARAHTNTNVDLGWAGSYNDGSYAHAGMFRDATDGVFKIFDSYTPEPDETATIDTGHASYSAASFRVNNLTAEGYVDSTYFVGDGANLTSILTNYSTTDLTEGTNLYFTDERVDDRVADLLVAGTNTSIVYDDIANTITISVVPNGGIDLSNNTTDDLAEGVTNLYYTDNRFDTRLSTKTTTDLTEGTNLYFTDERVDDRVSNLLVAGTNIGIVYDDGLGTLTISANGLTGNTTDDLTEGTTNLYFTDERVDDRVANLLVAGANITLLYDDISNTLTISGIEDNFSNNTTDDLAEGATNLYYTDARVDARLATFIVINDTSEFGNLSYNTLTGEIDHWGVTTSEIRNTLVGLNGIVYDNVNGEIELDPTYSPQFVNMTLTGNLTVQGTTTTVNTEQILLADNIITLNSDIGPATPPSENAGIEINRGNENTVAIRWNETTDSWQFTNNGTSYQDIGSLSASTTDDLAEGTTNLYYTDTRVRSAISASGDLSYDSFTGEFSVVTYKSSDFDSDFSAKSSDDLQEGVSNLYFTEERAQDAVASALVAGSNITITYDDNANTITIDGIEDNFSNNTTDDLAEGITNLYYTDVRVDDRINLLRTDLETSGSQDVHFGNLTNVPTTQTQVITGTGVQSYTMSINPGTAAGVIVTISGVTQEPISDYTVSGTTITFNPALPNGQKALLRYVGYQISGGTIVTATDSDLLDGLDSTQFLRSDTDDTMVGNLTMTGNIIPSANVTYNLGSSTNRWNELWLSTTTVNLGDNALSADANDNPLWNSVQFVLSDVSTDIIPVTDNTYNLGSTTKQFATIYGHEVEATYADLAERYETDAPYEPGTVVVFGGEAEITTTTIELDVSVAGVISTNPALKLNAQAGNSNTHPYVALRGRVPCKVVGPVKKGDLLVTSSIAGYAMSVGKTDTGRSVFAKSITEDLTDGPKIIEVVIV